MQIPTTHAATNVRFIWPPSVVSCAQPHTPWCTSAIRHRDRDARFACPGWHPTLHVPSRIGATVPQMSSVAAPILTLTRHPTARPSPHAWRWSCGGHACADACQGRVVALAGREPTGTDSAVKGDTAGSDIRVITSGVGTAATSGVMRRSSGEQGVDAHLTAGWRGVQRRRGRRFNGDGGESRVCAALEAFKMPKSEGTAAVSPRSARGPQAGIRVWHRCARVCWNGCL